MTSEFDTPGSIISILREELGKPEATRNEGVIDSCLAFLEHYVSTLHDFGHDLAMHKLSGKMAGGEIGRASCRERV